MGRQLCKTKHLFINHINLMVFSLNSNWIPCVIEMSEKNNTCKPEAPTLFGFNWILNMETETFWLQFDKRPNKICISLWRTTENNADYLNSGKSFGELLSWRITVIWLKAFCLILILNVLTHRQNHQVESEDKDQLHFHSRRLMFSLVLRKQKRKFDF